MFLVIGLALIVMFVIDVLEGDYGPLTWLAGLGGVIFLLVHTQVISSLFSSLF